MGLRYYYSLDIASPSHLRVPTYTSVQGRFSYPYLTQLLNLDMTVFLYEIQGHRFDFILGGGVGIRWSPGVLVSTRTYQDLIPDLGKPQNYAPPTFDIEAAINMGFRWMKDKYGFELMTKVPVTGPTILREPIKSAQRNNGVATIQPRFNLTLNFIAEL